MLTAKWSGQGLGCFSRPRDDDELSEFRQLPRLAPLRKAGYVIGADEVEEAGSGKTLRIGSECFHCIGGSAAFEFLQIQFGLHFAGQGQAKEADARGGWRRGGGRFEGRLCGGDEEQPFEVQFFTRGPGDQQVTTMHWIERAAV